MKRILIHIGKCGGSTCRAAIEAAPLRIDEVVHIKRPRIDAEAGYYIIARDPIARAISAFNWRYKLVIQDATQASRFSGEAEVLRRYVSLNALAEALYAPDGVPDPAAGLAFLSIHHLRENIEFYLGDLLRAISPAQVLGVVMQENLLEDMAAIFGIRPELRLRSHRAQTSPEMLRLSARATANLRRFLRGDFECLAILRAWGKIHPQSLEWRD